MSSDGPPAEKVNNIPSLVMQCLDIPPSPNNPAQFMHYWTLHYNNDLGGIYWFEQLIFLLSATVSDVTSQQIFAQFYL